MELKIIELGNEYTHLALIGRLVNLSVGEVEEEFLQLTAGRKLSAIVDISEVTFTGSTGLHMFLRAVKILREEKKVLILLNPQPMLKAVLIDSGMHEAVIIDHDLASAISRARA